MLVPRLTYEMIEIVHGKTFAATWFKFYSPHGGWTL